MTPWCAGVFEYLLENGKPPSKVRASDMRHILLVLPFLLHDLVRPEEEEHNRLNPAEEPLIDPSSDCIDITLLLLNWYRLFRRHPSVVWGIPNSYLIRYIINTYLKRHRLGVD